MADYRVNLEIFAGPMDLLLYLVRKEEVDIYDIPISKITDQYLHYIEMLKGLDIDLAGDFLVLAATLMQIKSAMLLPLAEPDAMEEGDIEDPRTELIRQLLEYKKFKDAANLLSDAAELQKERHARPDSIIEALKPEAEPELDIEQVSIWDLLEAFDSIIKATGGVRDISHIKDDTPIDLYQIQILGCLQDEGPMAFERLFEDKDERIVLIGLFLALLELVREELVWTEQEKDSGAIYLKALTDEPADEAVKRAVIAFKEVQEKESQVPIQEIEAKDHIKKDSGHEYEKVKPSEKQEN
ncbi:MAG: segregation and condensation protein A [Planctomycetota bacterium]|jgi:segregation and condensation protein A